MSKLHIQRLKLRRCPDGKGVTLVNAADTEIDFMRETSQGSARNRNRLIRMPTGSGKSFPTILLMLRTFLLKKKDVIFVVPYVSLAEDKVSELQCHTQYYSFVVDSYVGGKGAIPPMKRMSVRTAYVCTIEKFYVLTQSLYIADRICDIGLVVVDEAHMLGADHRGPTLETAVMQYVRSNRQLSGRTTSSRKDAMLQVGDENCVSVPSTTTAAEDCTYGHGHGVQLIGLSATVSNTKDLLQFMDDAILYEGEFRPVALEEYVLEGPKLMKVSSPSADSPGGAVEVRTSRIVSLYKHPELEPWIVLVMERLHRGKCCLVFCSTRNRTVQVAEKITTELKRIQNVSAPQDDLMSRRVALNQALASEVWDSAEDKDVLCNAVTCGVSYHHAGLSSSQRLLIEEAFRMRTVQVICCTSTLSAGVNLPAEMVLVLDLKIGNDTMSVSQYRQMAGRAGRAGLSESGHCIVVADQTNAKDQIVQRLICAPVEPVLSKLDENSMQRMVLMRLQKEDDTVTDEILKEYVQLSLYAVQSSVDELLHQCMHSLERAALVARTMCSEGNILKLTGTGKVAVRAIVSPHVMPSEVAVHIIRDLNDASSSLTTRGTDMHLVYLSVLRRGAFQGKPFVLDMHLLDRMVTLDPDEMRVADRLVICETAASSEAQGSKPMASWEHLLSVVMRKPPLQGSERYEFLTRFFLAFIISRLMSKRASLSQCARALGIPNARFLSTVELAAANAFTLSRICAQFPHFWSLKMLLAETGKRMSTACSLCDLENLTSIAGIGPHRARQLLKAGFKTPIAVAGASAQDLISVFGGDTCGVSVTAAGRMIISAQEYVNMSANDALEKMNEDIIQT